MKQNKRHRVLAIDVGGSHVKVRVSNRRDMRQFVSGPDLTPAQMVAGVHELTGDWNYTAVSIGYPGVVIHGLGGGLRGSRRRQRAQAQENAERRASRQQRLRVCRRIPHVARGRNISARRRAELTRTAVSSAATRVLESTMVGITAARGLPSTSRPAAVLSLSSRRITSGM
jgi:hypothetical protein